MKNNPFFVDILPFVRILAVILNIALLGFAVCYFVSITGFGIFVPRPYTIRLVTGVLIIATPVLNIAVLTSRATPPEPDSGSESD